MTRSLVLPQGLKRVFAGGFRFFSWNVAAGITSLFTVIIIARELGVGDFGRFATLQATIAVIMSIASFQSHRAFVPYASRFLEQGKELDVARLARLGYLFDGVSSAIGVSIAIVSMPLLVEWIGADSDIVFMAQLYCFSILVSLSRMGEAILQVLNRFGIYGFCQFTVAITRLLVLALLDMMGLLDISSALVAWMVIDLCGVVLMSIVAHNGLLSRGIPSPFKVGAAGILTENPKLLRTIFINNVHESIRMATRDGDVVVFSFIAGPAAAGMLRIVKQISGILMRLADPFAQPLFPELSRLFARGEKREMVMVMKHFSAYGMALSFVIILLAAFIGEAFISLIFGSQYVQIYLALIIHLVGTMLGVVSLPLWPALMAMEKPGKLFVSLLISSTVYIAALVEIGRAHV